MLAFGTFRGLTKTLFNDAVIGVGIALTGNGKISLIFDSWRLNFGNSDG